MSNDARTGNPTGDANDRPERRGEGLSRESTEPGDVLSEDQLDQVSGGATLLPDADRTDSETTEDQMKDSLRRTPQMTDLVNRLNGTSEGIQARIAGGSKG